MSDLLDKHSPEYDPDAFTGLVDDERKRRKENPAAFAIANRFTGELLDPDDLPALKTALQEIEDYLAEKRRPLRPIYETRDQIQARVAELEPIGLPRPRNQTAKQQRVQMCPRCRHILSDSDPQAAAPSLGGGDSSGEGSSTGAASTATLAEEQSSGSEKSVAAGPAAGMAPSEELSPPAGGVADGASPAPSLKEAL